MKLVKPAGRVLALALTLALLSGSALAAGEEVRVEDTVSGAAACALMGDGEPRPFVYDVPKGGAAVLIFFGINCGNCRQLFSGIAESDWADDPRVNIVAVECQSMSAESVRNFADACMGGKVQNIWYGGTPSPTWAYARLLCGATSIKTAFAVIVTEEEGVRYIRWHGQGVHDERTLREELERLLGKAPEPPEEGCPASASLTGVSRGNGRISFTARVQNQSGGALTGWLFAVSDTGGRLTETARSPLELAGNEVSEKSFTLQGENAELFYLDAEGLRPLMVPLTTFAK